MPKRDFICISDYNFDEIRGLLARTLELKSSKQSQALRGQTLAMILRRRPREPESVLRLACFNSADTPS